MTAPKMIAKMPMMELDFLMVGGSQSEEAPVANRKTPITTKAIPKNTTILTTVTIGKAKAKPPIISAIIPRIISNARYVPEGLVANKNDTQNC